MMVPVLLAQTSDWLWLALWLILIGGVLLSALYSAMETGVYVTNKIRLDLQAEAGSRPARLLRRMLRSPANLLAVIVVGVNAANYAVAFAISTMFVLAGAGGRAEWYTLLVATPLMFILAESVPKNISQRLGERLMMPLVWVLWISNVVYNAVGLALVVRGFSAMLMRLAGRSASRPPLGHEGFAAIVAEGQASGVLTHFQSIMADRIMNINRVRLSHVMIPMPRVTAAPQDISRPQLLALLRTNNYSRLPLLDASGQVAGVLDIYDVLNAADEAVPATKMVPPLVLSARTSVTDALYEMRRNRRMMAIVKSPAGKHVGVVTIKDIVEEIVGELEAW